LACTLEIARRHAPALADHNGSTIMSLWFRIMAVHGEALSAYIKRGNYAAFLKTIGGLGFRLLAIPAALLLSAVFGDGETVK